MKYDMKVPCKTCPFRKEGGVTLGRDRIKEIGGMMLDRQGGTFPCHKSVDYSDDDDNHGPNRISREGEIHCAGALIFAELNGTATQMMRIAERLRMYDHRVFTDEVKAMVWDTLAQWLRSVTPKRAKGKKEATP